MNPFPRFTPFAVVCLTLLVGCLAGHPDDCKVTGSRRAPDPEKLLHHTRVLASDEFEGRGPGSVGEDRTVGYLAREMERVGLRPGMPDGSWTQAVPIIGITSTVDCGWTGAAGRRVLEVPQDVVAWSSSTNGTVRVPSAPMIFVGYGVTAPEYGWDDYKGVDVRGKTVVMLVNDPPVLDPKGNGKLDPKMFQGRAMTYYGRWTYKFEEAARRGAVAALLIHETRAAAYPWFVVVNSWGKERFDLAQDPDPKSPVAGWLSLDAARDLFAQNGMTYEAALERAVTRGFRPIRLAQSFDAVITQQTRPVQSRNVLGLLEGSDPVMKSQYVIYSAHWDHLGRDARREGDQIYNGAADNAVGVAGLLELARTFAAAEKRPRRSVLFLAPTAEEQGLLGARHYASHPAYPLESTLANINMDGLNTWGRTSDLRQVGDGHSTLDEVLLQVVMRHKRRLLPDPHPERGTFYRSDHFEFMKKGLPALYLKAGDNYRDHPQGYGDKRVLEYIENDYHKVSDEVKPGWDLRGAAEDLEVLLQVGWTLAEGASWPQWKESSEFRTSKPRGPRSGR